MFKPPISTQLSFRHSLKLKLHNRLEPELVLKLLLPLMLLLTLILNTLHHPLSREVSPLMSLRTVRVDNALLDKPLPFNTPELLHQMDRYSTLPSAESQFLSILEEVKLSSAGKMLSLK